MIICEPTKVLFVHIQKTGGQTIQKILMEHVSGARHFLGTHDHARWARDKMGTAFDSHYKFAFVRNPWDRLVSWYSMIVEKAPRLSANRAVDQPGNYNRLWRYVLENAGSFEEFIKGCTATIDDRDGRKSFCFNQLDYLTDENDKVIVDDIFRFEHFEQECRKVVKRLGISAVRDPASKPLKT